MDPVNCPVSNLLGQGLDRRESPHILVKGFFLVRTKGHVAIIACLANPKMDPIGFHAQSLDFVLEKVAIQNLTAVRALDALSQANVQFGTTVLEFVENAVTPVGISLNP